MAITMNGEVQNFTNKINTNSSNLNNTISSNPNIKIFDNTVHSVIDQAYRSKSDITVRVNYNMEHANNYNGNNALERNVQLYNYSDQDLFVVDSSNLIFQLVGHQVQGDDYGIFADIKYNLYGDIAMNFYNTLKRIVLSGEYNNYIDDRTNGKRSLYEDLYTQLNQAILNTSNTKSDPYYFTFSFRYHIRPGNDFYDRARTDASYYDPFLNIVIYRTDYQFKMIHQNNNQDYIDRYLSQKFDVDIPTGDKAHRSTFNIFIIDKTGIVNNRYINICGNILTVEKNPKEFINYGLDDGLYILYKDNKPIYNELQNINSPHVPADNVNIEGLIYKRCRLSDTSNYNVFTTYEEAVGMSNKELAEREVTIARMQTELTKLERDKDAATIRIKQLEKELEIKMLEHSNRLEESVYRKAELNLKLMSTMLKSEIEKDKAIFDHSASMTKQALDISHIREKHQIHLDAERIKQQREDREFSYRIQENQWKMDNLLEDIKEKNRQREHQAKNDVINGLFDLKSKELQLDMLETKRMSDMDKHKSEQSNNLMKNIGGLLGLGKTIAGLF